MQLSNRERRVVLLGLGTIALILLLGRALPAWRRWAGTTHAAAMLSARRLARTASLVRTAPAIRDSLRSRMRRRAALDQLLLGGDSPSAAAAQLASLVSTTAAQCGAEIGTIDVRDDTAHARRETVVLVTTSVVGDAETLTHFLASLESGSPRVAIRSFTLISSDPTSAPNQPEVLHADLVAVALARLGP